MLQISIINGVGDLVTEIPTYIGNVKVTCPDDLGRNSVINLTFIGSPLMTGTSVPLNPTGKELGVDVTLGGGVSAIHVVVSDYIDVNEINVEFLPYVSEF